MLTLHELRSKLDDPDLRTKRSRAAQRYLATKGYADVRPFGSLEIWADARTFVAEYFYYVLDGEEGISLLELEVCDAVEDELGRDFVCRVTAHRPVEQ